MDLDAVVLRALEKVGFKAKPENELATGDASKNGASPSLEQQLAAVTEERDALAAEVTRLKTEKPAEHPVLNAALAAGIDSADKFGTVKGNSDAYEKSTNDLFSAEAVRRFGATNGPAKVAAYKHLTLADKEALAREWQSESDEKFGIGKNGEAASRQTAPAKLAQSANAESNGGGEGKLWDQLTDAQRDFATTRLNIAPEKREQYAATLLGMKEGDN